MTEIRNSDDYITNRNPIGQNWTGPVSVPIKFEDHRAINPDGWGYIGPAEALEKAALEAVRALTLARADTPFPHFSDRSRDALNPLVNHLIAIDKHLMNAEALIAFVAANLPRWDAQYPDAAIFDAQATAKRLQEAISTAEEADKIHADLTQILRAEEARRLGAARALARNSELSWRNVRASVSDAAAKSGELLGEAAEAAGKAAKEAANKAVEASMPWPLIIGVGLVAVVVGYVVVKA